MGATGVLRASGFGVAIFATALSCLGAFASEDTPTDRRTVTQDFTSKVDLAPAPEHIDFTRTLESLATENETKIREWLIDTKRFGISLASSLVKPVYVMRIDKDENLAGNGIDLVCSGTLLNSGHAITAAHCFCQDMDAPNQVYFKTFSDCTNAAHYKRLSYAIFSPQFGFAYVTGDPVLNPHFNTESADGFAGDIAVLRITGFDTSHETAIGTYPGGRSSRTFVGSVGPLAVSSPMYGGLIEKDVTYAAGIVQLAKAEKTTDSPGACLNKEDIICSFADGAVVEDNEFGDYAVCPGDSGGGVFLVDDTGDVSLIGVVSQRKDVSGDCHPSVNDKSFFVKTAPHKDWIETVTKKTKRAGKAGNRSGNGANPDCFSTPVWPANYELSYGPGRISIAVLREDHDQNPEISDIHLSRNISCSLAKEIGIFSCRFDKFSTLRYSLRSRGGQLTFCH